MTPIKDYDFDNMTIQEIADVAADLKKVNSASEKQLEKAKKVVKARFTEKEISKLSQGSLGEIEVREADDFHDLDAVEAFKAMDQAGFGSEFPNVCTVQLNNSGKNAKVKRMGITHYLAQAVVDKLRIKKRKKALTVYFRDKKED